MKRAPVPPLFVLIIGILAVSTGSIFVRFAQQDVPSLAIAAWRLTIATTVLAPLALTRNRLELLSLKKRDLILALLSGIFLALHFDTWILSLEYTSVASSVVLVSTAPLWVALLAPLTLKEPITRLVIAGMLLALLGGMIVGLSETCSIGVDGLNCPAPVEFFQGEAFLGNALALAGALMAALYMILGRRLRGSLSLVSYIFVVYGMAAVILIAIMLFAGYSAFGYPTEAYLWLLLLGLIPQLVGHSSFNWALGYLSAAFVSISLLGEPIGSTILAYLLLNETPSGLEIFGAILILSGILVASQSEMRQKQSASPLEP